MYRGSSFLLQKDYKVHKDIVIEINTPKYNSLWGINCEALLSEGNLGLLFKLSNRLKDIYVEKRKNIDGRKKTSDALITKILMGTLGCIPAYDTYFTSAVSKYEVASRTFNEKSVISLAKYYEKNQIKLEKCRQKLSIGNVSYPQMKLIDMAFWQLGYELEAKKVPKKAPH